MPRTILMILPPLENLANDAFFGLKIIQIPSRIMVLDPAQDFVSSDLALNHAEICLIDYKYPSLLIRDCSNSQGDQFVSIFLCFYDWFINTTNPKSILLLCELKQLNGNKKHQYW